MNLSRESRLDGPTLEKIASLWEEWLELLTVRQMKSGADSWLAVWLPESVEQTIDQAWEESPAKGYLFNCLAQYLCMSAIQELLPQVADGGCAPSPVMNDTLHDALAQAGLPCRDNPCVPERRYAVVTNYPFRGGCEICALREDCPKGKGMEDFASVLLPGYERRIDDRQGKA